MDYKVELNVYTGPLDLLYDLISKQKIDIKDISINDITNQYLDYISFMEKMDMEITIEFITMATKLLEIKSRYLLYRQNETEEDPRLELVEKLEEYKKYKLSAEKLKDSINYFEDTFFRKKEEVVSDEKVDFTEISLEAIKNLLPIIFKVDKSEEININDERLDKIVKAKIISVEEKIDYIRNIIKSKKNIRFFDIIKNNEKNEIIATFLSLLELIKSEEIIVFQDKFFDDITINSK